MSDRDSPPEVAALRRRLEEQQREFAVLQRAFTLVTAENQALQQLLRAAVNAENLDALFDRTVDLMMDLLSDAPISLDAQGLVLLGSGIDHAVAQMAFPQGVLATLTASRVTEQKVRSVEVTARGAYVVADLLGQTISLHRHTSGEYLNQNHRGVKYRQEGIVERIHVPAFEPLLLELQRFVDSILDGKPSAVPADDGLRALQLAYRVRSSIEARRRELSFPLPS